MVMRLHSLIAAACLLCWPAVAATADITVQADRDPVSMNESFQIEFEAHGEVDDDPDFSPLNRDFNILSSTQSTSFSFINGQSSRSKTWTLTVLARRTGRLVIPPVAFGADRSPATGVTVTAGTAGGTSREAGDIFLEVEARPLQPLVQAQSVYTARLFVSGPLADATLSEPTVESGDAVIERLGDDRNYETQVMGRRFRVLERTYAVFPQASGKLVIGPLQFQGRIGRDRFSLLDPFGPQPRSVVRQSAPVTLDVQPIPGGFTAPHWLPATNVHLTETWSADPPVFTVGEPLTRTLILSADGLSASQLPELSLPYPEAVRTYPDQPVLDNKATPSGIIGSRQEKIAIIPSAPGEYVLPAIRVPWWNTQTGALEYAELPERRIAVQPRAGTEMEAAVPAPATEQIGRSSWTKAMSPPQGASPATVPRTWMMISLFLAAGWLLTVLLWLRQRRAGASPVQQHRIETARSAARAVADACNNGDPRRVRDALLRWAALHWIASPPRSVGELAARCEGELAAELRRLNSVLYARQAGDWNGKTLRRAFEQAAPRAEARLATEDSALEPLFRL